MELDERFALRSIMSQDAAHGVWTVKGGRQGETVAEEVTSSAISHTAARLLPVYRVELVRLNPGDEGSPLTDGE